MGSPATDIISRLRPRTVGEIIDRSFRIYRRNFRTFLLITAVVYLPVQLLSYGIDVALGNYTPPDYAGPGSVTGTLAARNLISQVDTFKTYVVTFLNYFGTWALTVAISRVMVDSPATFGEAYGEVRRRFGAVLGLIGLQALIVAGFLSPLILAILAALSGQAGSSGSLIIGVGSCLSIFTLIYSVIQVRLEVIVPAAVNEELSPREALSRSWELTRNYWWRTFALTIVLGILRAIVVLGPGAVLIGLASLVFKFDYYANLALIQAIGIFTAVVYIPVETGAIALYYYDQRVRKEGFDIDTAIAQRYESGAEPAYGWNEGQASTYGYPTYGQTVPVAPAPLELSVPKPPPGTASARSVRQDRDLYPLLASGQHDQAMKTFSRRLDRIPHRKARVVSAAPAKRKVPRYPKPSEEQDSGK